MTNPIYHLCPSLLMKYLEPMCGVRVAYECTFHSDTLVPTTFEVIKAVQDEKVGHLTFCGQPLANWSTLYSNTNIPLFHFLGDYKYLENNQTNFWRRAALHLAGLEYNREGLVVQENAIMDCKKFRALNDRANEYEEKRFKTEMKKAKTEEQFNKIKFPNKKSCYV